MPWGEGGWSIKSVIQGGQREREREKSEQERNIVRGEKAKTIRFNSICVRWGSKKANLTIYIYSRSRLFLWFIYSHFIFSTILRAHAPYLYSIPCMLFSFVHLHILQCVLACKEKSAGVIICCALCFTFVFFLSRSRLSVFHRWKSSISALIFTPFTSCFSAVLSFEGAQYLLTHFPANENKCAQRAQKVRVIKDNNNNRSAAFLIVRMD